MISIIYPTKVKEIISRYGPRSLGDKFHDGIDFLCPVGTKVVTVASGKVVKIGWSKSYGNYIIIEHYGFCTLIAHFSSITVKVGDKVNQGDLSGLSGDTGECTDPHVHLEIRLGSYDENFWRKIKDYNRFDNSVDPELYLFDDWRILAGRNALSELHDKGLVSKPEHWAEKLLEPLPAWVIWDMLNRIAKSNESS